MNNIVTVLRFGWPYLQRYWTRLAAGIALGTLFGLSNASFVWATKTLTERFNPAHYEASASIPPDSDPGATNDVKRPVRRLIGIATRVQHWIDPWLPRMGEPLDWRRTLGGLVFLPLLVLMRGATDYGSGYCMSWISERVINDMRLDVLRKLGTLSISFFNRSTTGDLLTRINSDTAKLLRCLKQGAADLIKESVALLGAVSALLLLNWRLTLVALVFVPVCVFPLVLLGKKARRASRGSVNAEVLQSSQLVELLASMRIIKAYNLESRQMDRYRHLSKQLVHHGMKGVQAKELVNPLVEVISMLGLGVLVIYIFMTGTSIGDFIGFLTGLMLSFVPIKKLAGVHILFEQASVGAQRLDELMREQPNVKEPVSPKRLAEFRSEVRFDHVSFAYQPGRPVLQEFDLVAPRGTKIGIAGPSGSGKSTVVNLLLRFYDPTHGAITIDGVDLRNVSFQDLRNCTALVTQEIILFDETVAENIALGKTGATRAEIESAAREAYAHDFIRQLPQGYDTRVGERGVTLSGGQRQRIAIARAFVRNAPILVLDEATASLDSEAEAEVQRAIEHLSENRTVISVAHRLSTLSRCDRIIVLVDGRIVEQGGFDELLRRGGLFSSMAEKQRLERLSPKEAQTMVRQD